MTILRTLAFSLSLFIFHSLPVFGQDSDRFSLRGQIRHRTEFDARDFDAEKNDIWFHLLRTRIGLDVAVASDISTFIQVQDSRVFGGEDPARGRGTLDGSAQALDLHQAYFSVNNMFGTPFTVQIGRQEMAYGNQRLIGAVGWSNVGRSFDAGVLTYAARKAVLDIFAARLVGSLNNSTGQNLYGVYGTLRPASSQTIDGFLLVDNNTAELTAGPDEGKSLLNRFTLGTRGHGSTSEIDYELELIYQGGTEAPGDSMARLDIKSYLLNGMLGYTFKSKTNVRVGLGYTILSGDKSGTDNESNAVNTLFATNHKFYGFMDFFPATLPQQGLQDLTGSIALSPVERLRLRLDVHHFTMAETILEEGVFGQEIDFTTNYQYNSLFFLQAGLSAFFPGKAIEGIRGKDTAFWFYLMSTVNF